MQRNRKRRTLIGALLAAGFWIVLASAAFAACPTTSLTFKDAAGVTQTLCFDGASGAYVPQYQIMAQSGGSPTDLIVCNSVATYNASTSGATQLVALSSGKAIYVCGYTFFVGATATNVGLEYGTGTNCASGTGTTNMPPSYPLPAGGAIVDHTPFYNGIVTPASDELCILTSAGNPVTAIVYYDQH